MYYVVLAAPKVEFNSVRWHKRKKKNQLLLPKINRFPILLPSFDTTHWLPRPRKNYHKFADPVQSSMGLSQDQGTYFDLTFFRKRRVMIRQGSRACYSKCQLISKALFVFFNSPKKQMKNFCPSRLGEKLKFSSLFFGRIEETKIIFRD